jgi:hypothetical protein
MAERRGWHRAAKASCRGSPLHVAGIAPVNKTGTGDDDPTLLDEVAA